MSKKSKTKSKMRLGQRILLIVAILMLLTGVGFLLFPPISNTVGQVRANAIINDYEASLNAVYDPASPDSASEEVRRRVTSSTFEQARQKGEVDKEGYAINENGERISSLPVIFQADLDRLRRDSIAYNQSLLNHQGTPDTTDFERAAFDLGSYGLTNIYAFLKADSIGLSLPVYLGANDWAMSCGGAHLYGTSLPVNMNSTNVAIAGHTGYVGRIFFDNIRNLQYGDTVTITNYWEIITYKVIDFKEVAPGEANDVLIKPNRRLLTLITCTPSDYGGFNRFLVICEAAT